MNKIPRDQNIDRLASDLRLEVGLGLDEPIQDIDALIKSMEYHYHEDRFGDDFSGASQYIGSEQFIIYFNKDHHWSEKFRRFTLVHEIGHLTIPTHSAILHTNGFHFSTTEFTSSKDIEREADEFAINFLAPKNAFKKKMALLEYTREDISSLSDTFEISMYAAAIRYVKLVGDYPCSLIACHKDGTIMYEIRSDGMRALVRGHHSLNGLPVPPSTLADEFIKGNCDTDDAELYLSDWYHDFPTIRNAQESIIELGYNDLYLALLEPLPAESDEEDYEGLEGSLPSVLRNGPREY